MYKTSELFDLTKSAAGGYLAKFEYPWQALAGLKGAECHSTVILSQVDVNVLKKLGINYTADPIYQTKKLYHAK